MAPSFTGEAVGALTGTVVGALIEEGVGWEVGRSTTGNCSPFVGRGFNVGVLIVGLKVGIGALVGTGAVVGSNIPGAAVPPRLGGRVGAPNTVGAMVNATPSLSFPGVAVGLFPSATPSSGVVGLEDWLSSGCLSVEVTLVGGSVTTGAGISVSLKSRGAAVGASVEA